MNTVLISLTVITGVVLISALGFFGTLRGKESREERKERAIEWVSSELDLTNELDLTKEQRSKLVHISDELSNLENEMKKDHNELKEEFINSIASDELDQAKILEWIKEKEKQVDEFAPVIIAELADFHKSLNPEQRKKLADEAKKLSKEQDVVFITDINKDPMKRDRFSRICVLSHFCKIIMNTHFLFIKSPWVSLPSSATLDNSLPNQNLL